MATINRGRARKLILTLFAVLLASSTIYLFAKQNGQTGRTSSTSQGCSGSECHASSASGQTTLSAAGKFTVEAGSTNNFSITINNASAVVCGIDIGVKTTEAGGSTAGTLSPASGSGLFPAGGELTHSSPVAMSNGSHQFGFSWKAPSTTGTYYLKAIGNACNGNGKADAGDLWNWMTPVAITVVPQGTLNDVPDLNTDNFDVSVYPNPVNDHMVININSAIQANLNLNVYDLAGNSIKSFGYQSLVGGQNAISWDVLDNSGYLLVNGTYFLNFSSGKSSITVPFVVAR